MKIKPIVDQVCRIVRCQFKHEPNHNLMFSIFRQTMYDAFIPDSNCIELERDHARKCLGNKDFFCVSVCDVDFDWVKRLIKYHKLFVDE
mgnify:CR=1 FL=1